MIARIVSAYKAGKSGQPMPANADRSVGETAAGAALTVGLVAGVFFAVGVGTAAADRILTPKEVRENRKLKAGIEAQRLRNELDRVRKASEVAYEE